jgi:hypothetical protein
MTSSSPKKHQTTIWIDPPDFNICQLDCEVDIFKSFCVYAEMIASPGQALDSPLPSLVEILIDSDLVIQAVHRK